MDKTKLSEIQFKTLIEAQIRVEQCQQQIQLKQRELVEQQSRLNEITSLIFDMYQIIPGSKVSLDPTTYELNIESNNEESV